ncbi:putative acetyl xylan esterase [Mycena pura]|uniref:Acetyl xylan esterase n=1 Tax=Mycena pura TaxID=153505 RepID=A0AAD6Y796_9AGAR|nr:putative acetyl xylan esterase [Mycena pura]
MQISITPLVLLLGATFAAAQCPNVHVFGARETTAPPGFGTAASVVQNIVNAFPGATDEVINYPACGGQASCGSVSYASSAVQGVSAVANQVNSFNSRCPSTVLVLVGYSQGGQIMDDAYCGGGDTNEGLSSTAIPISAAAQKKIAAAIFMGDPRHIPGLSYNVGTCQASGFAPRPAGFQCPFASNIQSYCDAPDPFCCNGSDQATHQGYAVEYGAVALTFVRNKVNAMLGGSGSAPPTTTVPPSSPTGGTVAEFGQCGGQGWTGGTVCVSPFVCTELNAFFFQCLTA